MSSGISAQPGALYFSDSRSTAAWLSIRRGAVFVCAASSFAFPSVSAAIVVLLFVALAARARLLVSAGEMPADRPSIFSPQSPQALGVVPFAALKEGGGAPEGATFVQPLRAARLKRQARRLAALRRGDFGPRDRTSGTRTADSSPA
jgi:hypothetical protein